MCSIISRPTDVVVNYIEYIKANTTLDDDQGTVLQTVNENEFKHFLQMAKSHYKHIKPFTKTFKQFLYKNVFYSIVPNSGEVTVYSLEAIQVLDNDKGVADIAYHKNKLSILMLPRLLLGSTIDCT